ncbi:ABC transporter ATP-binding protein [Inquilinus sp. CAU 1745]|uniref:ABC transporter ATP-binding protein n=1 Tax=Inquilinus sp. CAU 1745 TaxID=3140369 RepID=UPI00325B2FBB
MTESMNAIEIRSLVKRFGDFQAVAGVDFVVPKGAFLTLVGPSGCGKSTMLRMLAGLEPPTEGEIVFNGRTVSSGEGGVLASAGARDAGLVFQSYALWPHMTVAGNVDWPLKVAKMPAAARRERVAEVLALLDIGELAERYPGEISGGQQQRVAIARMLAPQPSILLFDEPLSNLDAKLRVEMRSELMRLHRATGATAVYVTHDQVEAMTMATHVAVMKDGLVQQFGPPEALMDEPETAFVATFIGTPPGNLLPAEAREGRFDLEGIDLGPAPSRTGRYELLFRPEALTPAEPGTAGTLSLSFAEATPIAGRVMVTGLRGDGLRIVGVVDRHPGARLGDPIAFRLPERPAAIFDASGRRVA